MAGASSTRRFLYDGDALVAEYQTTGALAARFVHGAGAGDDPLIWYGGGENRRLHADHQGSIVAITYGTGAIRFINGYDEYGIPNPGNAGRFQYTGQAWLGDIGMYHYKARIYSPTLGRFLQVDPVGYEDQIHLYAYVGNDPVNALDPNGLATIVWSGDNRAHVIFYTRMVQTSPDHQFSFTGQALQQFVAGAVQGTTNIEGRQVSVTSEVVIVAPDDMVTGGADTRNMYQDSPQNHRPGSSYTDPVTRDIHLQPQETLNTAGHEVPHPAGAGDQREGGVDANGERIPHGAGPFPNTLMNNSAPHVNAQTLSEILECECNIHIRVPR